MLLEQSGPNLVMTWNNGSKGVQSKVNMANTQTLQLSVKPGLTRQIINLHQHGYADDFVKMDNDHFLCVGTGGIFEHRQLEIKIHDQIFDRRTGRCAYLHSIETPDGLKGLLFMESVCFNCCTNTL